MSGLKSSIENPWVCDIVTDEVLARETGVPLPSHAQSDQAFCTPHALRSWARAFLPAGGWSGPLRHVRVRQNGQLQALIPFARQQVARFSINSLAGYYWPFRSLCLLAQPGAGMGLADAVGRALANTPPGAVLRFGPISGRDEVMLAMLRQLMAAGWRHRAKATGAVFQLDLSLGLDALKQRFSGSLLRHIEYSRRRLSKTVGEVRCERHVLSGEDQPLLDILAGIESRSWLGRDGGDLKFVGPANQLFWTQMGREPDPHADKAPDRLDRGGAKHDVGREPLLLPIGSRRLDEFVDGQHDERLGGKIAQCKDVMRKEPVACREPDAPGRADENF